MATLGRSSTRQLRSHSELGVTSRTTSVSIPLIEVRLAIAVAILSDPPPYCGRNSDICSNMADTRSPVATLLGVPAEIRIQILQYLLCCDNVLADVSNAVANHNNPRRSHINHDSNVASYGGSKFEEIDLSYDGYVNSQYTPGLWASCRTFKLYPTILQTCRQLQQEGHPLLYDCNKTVEVGHLMFFNWNFHQTSHESRSYCLGCPSIESALEKWPALRSFRNWAYTIYLGPLYHEDSVRKGWSTREKDIEALSSIPINKLTITCFDTSRNNVTSRNDGAIFESCVIPFHRLYCQSATILGPVPSPITQIFYKFLVQRPSKSMTACRGDITKLDNDIERYMKCCRTLRENYKYQWRHVVDPARHDLNIAMSTWEPGLWYPAIKLVLDTFDDILVRTEVSSNECKAGHKCYSNHDPQVLAQLRSAVDTLRQETANGAA